MDGRAAPPREQDAARGAGDHERRRARHRLLAVPRPSRSADRAAADGREAVAERENPPCGGDDVETVRKREQEHQDRDRIEDDAVHASLAVAGPIEAFAGDPRQQQEVEGERGRCKRHCLPPRQPPQQQRERAHRNMDGLASRLREPAVHAGRGWAGSSAARQ